MTHDEDDAFLRSIPPFLRRSEERPASRPAERPRAVAPETCAPEPRTPEAPAAPSRPAAPRPPARPPVRLELAYRNRAFGDGSEDVPFEVALPRGVVGQLRALAAEKGTSERTVVLRALRLAGLSVPEPGETVAPRRRPA